MSTQLLSKGALNLGNVKFSGDYLDKEIHCGPTKCSDGSCSGDCTGSCWGSAAGYRN